MTTGLPHVPISLHSRPHSSLPFIPSPSAPLPRSTPSFFSQKSTHLPQENEIFLPLVTLLLMGKWMQLNGCYWEIFCVKIWFVFSFCSIFATANEKRTASKKSWPKRGWLRKGRRDVSEDDISKVTYLWLTYRGVTRLTPAALLAIIDILDKNKRENNVEHI